MRDAGLLWCAANSRSASRGCEDLCEISHAPLTARVRMVQ